jgi:hypothetical protein
VLEQEYMDKARIRQKAGITKPQIVAGREFKGVSFISKPEVIMFKVIQIHKLKSVGLHSRRSSYSNHPND